MERKKEIEIGNSLYYFISGLLMLLDEGKFEEIKIVIDECENGNIYQYINSKYDLPFWKNINIDGCTISKLFKSSGSGVGLYESKRSFGIGNNGLVYLISLATYWLKYGFEYLIED